MKKFFHYLAAALLVGSSLAATSCSDDPEEPIIPQFPTPLPQQTIQPGGTYNITIKPNMDWVVAIPDEALQWFYLDDKGTKVSKLRGAAVTADQSITIKVGAEDVELFDAVEPVEVTMTMGTETKTIATLTIQHTARELKFYMAEIEDGDFVYNDDSALQYSYETEAKPNGFSVQLEEHGAFYSARLLVESNVPWTISVPEWIEVHVNTEVATSGAAGQSEVELRADYAKMPLEGAADVACSFNATAVDGSSVELAKIAVSLENLTGLLEYDLPDEALFSARGNYLPNATTHGPSINSTITAPKDVQVFAIGTDMWGDYTQCDWVTPNIDAWSGDDKIQSRDMQISVAPQPARWDSEERQAYVYVLPATMKDVTVDKVIAERETYQQYLATTITQKASTFLLNAQNSLAMEENGVKFENDTQLFDSNFRNWNDWMLNDYGLYYKLTYTKEWSIDGGALDVCPIPDGGPTHYSSYKIYGYNVGSAGEYLPEDNKWIKLQERRNAETNVVESFTVQMNFDQEYVNTYGDFSKKYAAIVFYDETGTAIATLECEYNENASDGDDTGAVKFMYEAAANDQGATLTLLTASDPDYQKYFGDYSSMNPSIYRLTYTQIETLNMTMITGLPDDGQNFQLIDDAADWIEVNPGQSGTTISVKDGKGVNGAKGACFFMSGDGNNAVIIVVELKLQ